MCCVVMVEEAGDVEVRVVPPPEAAMETVDWRVIAFGLARFARHRPECHQHPFDRPCHCGYEEVWAEFKRREREYYLASIGPAVPERVEAVAHEESSKKCRVARSKKGKAGGGREV